MNCCVMMFGSGPSAVVVFSSIKVSSALPVKVRQGCAPPGRFVLCFHCSAWARPFYGLTADVSELT